MGSLRGIYAWVIAPLGSSMNLNDFATPTTYLTSALSSLLQNGQSTHGVLPSPNLPLYLDWGRGGIVPWGNRSVVGTNPYKDIPNTGNEILDLVTTLHVLNTRDLGLTRHYEFTIKRGIIAPDGVNKSSILINDQSPGVR